MKEEKAIVIKIQQVFALNPQIPDFQRPYKWTIRHVQQLVNDLWQHYLEDKIYRIGTIVVHDENNKKNIVDGQQRLVSLSILLYSLGKTEDINTFLGQKFAHSISQYNINQNYGYLKSWVQENLATIEQKNKFIAYLLEVCEIVCVTLNELDEAFQFFDSQNARGKPLASYDLLKAYHLREMNDKSESLIHQCVAQWEAAALASDHAPNLNTIINQTLFRLRRWIYRLEAQVFTNQQLDTFKGISESESSKYPYLHSTLSAHALAQLAKTNPLLFQSHLNSQGFQTIQPIINGEWFFAFIEYYRMLYRKLFDKETGKLTQINQINGIELDKNLLEYLDSYTGYNRTGDRYLRNLFENVVFAYFDKFGENQLDTFINKAFLWVYRLRIQHARIGYATIENEALSDEGLLKKIENAYTPSKVFQSPSYKFDKKFDNIDERFIKIFELGTKQ